MLILYVYVCLKAFRQIPIKPLSFLKNVFYFIVLSIGFVGVFIIGFAIIYVHFGLLYTDNSITQNSRDCLYFSIITITTVGYGDFRPTPDVRLFAGLEALTGVVFFSLFISTLIHITNTQNK
jgi:hypothetical protein